MAGPDTWVYTTLHDFTYNFGHGPQSPVTLDAGGTLYGTTSIGGHRNNGVVWMIKS